MQCLGETLFIFIFELLRFGIDVSKAQARDIHYRVLQTIQLKLRLLCVGAERAVLGSTKTALKFEYEIQIG